MVDEGKIKIGDKFFEENELSAKYKTDSLTIDRAILELVNSENICVLNGKIFSCNDDIMKRPAGKISSFFSETSEQNLKASSKILGQEVVPCNRKSQSLLQLKDNEQVIKIDRLRLVDDQPLAFQTNYVPYKFCSDLVKEDLRNQSFQKLLMDKYEIRLKKALEFVQAIPSFVILAKLLEIDIHIPILKVERIAYIENDIPAVLSILLFRGDKYKYSSWLTEL